ncbi:MAG: ATP-binding cassette domain-containing protein, partial [Opitutales bacterium]
MYESMIMEEVLLRITNLRVHFPIRGGIFRSAVGACKAVDGVSLDLKKGQTLGLVGESGCGKSTLAKSVVKLVEPTSGSIKFKNQEVIGNNVQNNFRRSVQMVFQDPAESLNTRMTVGAILEEPLEIHRLIEKKDRAKRVVKLLEQVGLDS